MRHGFLKLFQSKSVDIAQPDVGACGGITELKRITDLANTFGIEIVPHCWGTGIVLHVCSDQDHLGYLESPEKMGTRTHYVCFHFCHKMKKSLVQFA